MYALLPGKNLKEDGDIDASIFQYRLAIELKHDLASALVSLGVGLSKVGRDDEAMDVYKVTTQVIPFILPDSNTGERIRFVVNSRCM